MNELFITLDSERIAERVLAAQRFVCYAGPGVHRLPAEAMLKVAEERSVKVTLCVDFDENVLRMGYGDFEATAKLRDSVDVMIRHSPGLRVALLIVDDDGFVFTPTALYLEAEHRPDGAANAMRLSSQQVQEAMIRLSPAARAIAVAQAEDPEEKARIQSIPEEVNTVLIDEKVFASVKEGLDEAPPVRFDLARQVRVFEPYLQYVEMSLTGAAIQRHRLAIPPVIQKLGESEDLEGRLRTTFDLIEKGSKLSSQALEQELNEIRKNFTPSIGKKHGRVVLKAAKPHLEQRLDSFRSQLEEHKTTVEKALARHLETSRRQVVDYYLPRAVATPPDALLGQTLFAKPSKAGARKWLETELDAVFPTAQSLVKEMQLDVQFKDVTFETLNQPDFLDSLAIAFPHVNWEKAYNEFKAAGEAK